MEATVVRYCPKCSAQVQGPESLFETPCRCPTCGERSQFYDYPNEPTPTPAKASGRHNFTLYDRLLWVLVIIAICAGCLALYAIVSFSLTASLISSLVCLLAGLGCTGYIAVLNRRIDWANQDKKKYERALMVSNAKVSAAAELNQGFKRNLDALAEDTKRRVLEQIASREEQVREMQTVVATQVEETSKVLPTMDIVATRLLDEIVHRLSKDLNSSNLAQCRGQLKQAIEFCRENGANIKRAQEDELLKQLEMDHQANMLEAKYKNERLLVEEKIRDEQRVIDAIEDDIRSAEAERSSIAKSLSAILRAEDKISESEIEDLREQLRLAEQKMSEASATMRRPSAGHVYVLSNIGSFGEGIYLIGVTRLADPKEHIEELSGISVPFPFDLHMLIPSENADELSTKICGGLHEMRLNRFNHGRRFFKCSIKDIWQQVVAHHGMVDYVEEPLAEEYRESCLMSDEAFQRMTEMHMKPEKYRDPFEARNHG